MTFFGLFNNGPYMAWAKKLPVSQPSQTLRNATYQVVASPAGLPMVQLDMQFQRWNSAGRPVSALRQMMFQNNQVYDDWFPSVANPHMSLCVLMDRSGSMRGDYNNGHVYNVCANIRNYVASAGVGYDMIFYDDRVSPVPNIRTDADLRAALEANKPRGGTEVTQALRMAVSGHKKGKGVYIIVITDGEFMDKLQAQAYVMDELVPLLKGDNPYAVRLHFVGAGEGADHEFLENLESTAAGQGVQLVTAHHHGHLSHTHDSILDELDRAFIGTAAKFHIEEAGATDDPIVSRIGDVTGRHWINGASADFQFIPRHAVLGVEFKQHHPPKLPLRIDIDLPVTDTDRNYNFDFNVPLPKSTAATTSGARRTFMDLLWKGQSPEERAARDALLMHEKEVHEAEMKRQSEDLIELAKGGIPVEAKARLLELGKSADSGDHIFSSNLAPDEIALLRKHGYKVRGMVSGSAMYHVGQSYVSITNDCEVQVLSQAYDTATDLAISRMEKELLYIGAHGAVGVRLNLVRHEWGEKTIEVQAIGTAIEGPGPMPTRPWLSDLSGQEWYALHRAGYEPVALVYGHCAWFILTTYMDEMIKTGWTNQELSHWSDALSTARHRALAHVIQQTREAGGFGVTGVHVARKLNEVRVMGPGENPVYEREHHNLVVSVIGTAIRLRADAPRAIRQTANVLSLRDQRLKPVLVHQAADLTLDKEE